MTAKLDIFKSLKPSRKDILYAIAAEVRRVGQERNRAIRHEIGVLQTKINKIKEAHNETIKANLEKKHKPVMKIADAAKFKLDALAASSTDTITCEMNSYLVDSPRLIHGGEAEFRVILEISVKSTVPSSLDAIKAQTKELEEKISALGNEAQRVVTHVNPEELVAMLVQMDEETKGAVENAATKVVGYLERGPQIKAITYEGGQ